jgi:hypothetical protein
MSSAASVYDSPEFGQNENWQFLLNGMTTASKYVYEKVIRDFFIWRAEQKDTSALHNSVMRYLKHLHDLKDPRTGQPLHAGSTFKPKFTMFGRFFLMCGLGDLKVLAPALFLSCVRWGKLHKTKKACAFLEHELCMFYTSPDTPFSLIRKAYGVLSMSFAARGCEAIELDFADITVAPGHSRKFVINFTRSKRQSCIIDQDYAVISGKVEVQIIDDYMECFPVEDQRGRFFRKLAWRNHRIVGTNQKIGINTARNYSKEIAKLLGIPTWEMYTSHSWRRTALTMAAARGLTLVQMKALSGHRSDSVVQGFIQRGTEMHEVTAAAVSIGRGAASSSSSSASRPGARPRPTDGGDLVNYRG